MPLGALIECDCVGATGLDQSPICLSRPRGCYQSKPPNDVVSSVHVQIDVAGRARVHTAAAEQGASEPAAAVVDAFVSSVNFHLLAHPLRYIHTL